jgi:hypothetical protein
VALRWPDYPLEARENGERRFQHIAQIATACRPSDATIGAEPKSVGVNGDVMTYDLDSAIQSHNRLSHLQEYAGQWGASYYEQMMPKTDMLIGDWYLDEFGNRSREIKARD